MIPDWMKKENTGMWTVGDDYIVTQKGERKYLCRCDCGTERYVLERSLRYGGSKSCGCLMRKRAIEANEHKLNGQVFTDLTVLRKAEKKQRNGGTWWVCKCSCGNVVEVSGTLLVTGRKTHCGCKTEPKKYFYKDITNQRFNRLTVKYIAKRENGVIYWHCVCDCGNEVDIPYNELVHCNQQSCGCQKRKHDAKLKTILVHVDGTSIDMLRSKKVPTDSTTGVRGVYFIKGKYETKIVFQGKQFYLGKYDNIEDAAKARREAEMLLFDGVVAHYDKWKSLADADPEWAEEHPIEIAVEKKNNSELSVTMLPLMA